MEHIEVLYTENAIRMLSNHITATHRNNKVGQYTNQINRRFYKANTNSARQMSQAISLGLKDEMSQSNLIDAAKKYGKELDIERQTIERRKAPYELYKFCDAKRADGSFYPQEDCPIWAKLISDKEKYISGAEAHGVMAMIEKHMQNLPTELFFHRTWTCQDEEKQIWSYKSELNELGMETLREQDDSMLSTHGTLDVLNEMFSFEDFSAEWQRYTDSVDYQGSTGSHIAVFRYVPYFVYAYKDATKGTAEYERVYEILVEFLTSMVMNHYKCDRETAIASVTNAAYKYVFTTDPAICEGLQFARTSELLTLAFMSRWEENQLANGEAAMDADFTMPEVLDEENVEDDEDEDLL